QHTLPLRIATGSHRQLGMVGGVSILPLEFTTGIARFLRAEAGQQKRTQTSRTGPNGPRSPIAVQVFMMSWMSLRDCSHLTPLREFSSVISRMPLIHTSSEICELKSQNFRMLVPGQNIQVFDSSVLPLLT